MEARRQNKVLRRGWLQLNKALSLSLSLYSFIGAGKRILNCDGVCLRRNYSHPAVSHVTTLNIMLASYQDRSITAFVCFSIVCSTKPGRRCFVHCGVPPNSGVQPHSQFCSPVGQG